MSNRFRFCPQCSSELRPQRHGEIERFGCALPGCGYVHWNNPVPVVAAVVQHEGKILLARNVAWPQKFFALITGFLEKDDPSPEQAALREVEEELGLHALAQALGEILGCPFGFLGEAANSVGGHVAGCVPTGKIAGKNAKQMIEAPLKAYLLLGAEPELDMANPRAAMAVMKQAELVVGQLLQHVQCREIL